MEEDNQQDQNNQYVIYHSFILEGCHFYFIISCTNSFIRVALKIGLIGDSQIGKTSLMVKYVEGSFDEDYIQTLGVNFMDKRYKLETQL